MGAECEVWDCITPELASHFTLHLVDLPGYGRSGGFGRCRWRRWRSRCWTQAPQNAIWLGWSLGGLVASQIALPTRTRAGAGDGGLFALF
jgi:pimeloyl-[acyl-carrier protein] methyl ester esterase